jgi:hypothetical protein
MMHVCQAEPQDVYVNRRSGGRGSRVAVCRPQGRKASDGLDLLTSPDPASPLLVMLNSLPPGSAARAYSEGLGPGHDARR